MKNDDVKTETQGNAETAIDLANSNEQIVKSHSPITGDGFDLSALPASEQLEIVREMYEAESQLEAMALPQYKSSDLIGRRLNILDAAFKSIPETVNGVTTEKACVSFVCEFADGDNAGEQFTVLKGSNPFNDIFANRFSKFRGIMSRPLNDYEFVEDARYNKAGNNAIVLRRIPAGAIAASKGK